jgi:hypothetical protein
MSQPTRFVKANTYTGDAYTGADIDEDFDNAGLTLDGLCDNLELIQRDDGKLANASVHPGALNSATLAMIGNFNPTGEWATATHYDVRDVVEESGASYVANTEHVSAAAFATDRTAGYWNNIGQDPSNAGDGVGVFLEGAEYKTLVEGPSDNCQITDLGEEVQIEVPDSPGNETGAFDIEFEDHTPVGDFHFQHPRATLALFDSGEAIDRITLTTPYPADSTELKAVIDLNVKGRLETSVTPDDAQLFHLCGKLHLDREGSVFIDGTPSFSGDASSGMKLQVGTIGGFVAVEITGRLAAQMREFVCIASGTSYCEDNDTTAFVLEADGAAITGPTDVYGCSGLRAFAVTDATDVYVAGYYESLGELLYLTGEIGKATGWAEATVLFNIPAPFRPRAARYSQIYTAAVAGTHFFDGLIFGTNGDVTINVSAAHANPIYLNFGYVKPIRPRGF